MVTESIEEINLADYLVMSTWKCTIFLGGHFAESVIDWEASPMYCIRRFSCA